MNTFKVVSTSLKPTFRFRALFFFLYGCTLIVIEILYTDDCRVLCYGSGMFRPIYPVSHFYVLQIQNPNSFVLAVNLNKNICIRVY